MLPLSTDKTFNYELVRILGQARSYGSDIGEVLSAAEKIEPGDFESWYTAFYELARHIHADLPDARHRVSTRNALFRAASYYRAADFFLHGKPQDPRIALTWNLQTACFNHAISLMDIPGQRFELKTPEFTVPGVFYRTGNGHKRRPTILLCNGYDGSQEEMLHVFGFSALERGFNVITFEGPGQPSVARDQALGFITEWEKVVSPVLDFCEAQPEIDPSGIVLLGYSFGGFLATRAAAFENRLASVICVDGIFNAHKAFANAMPPELLALFQQGHKKQFDQLLPQGIKGNTGLTWGVEQGLWAFHLDSAFDFLERSRTMTMENLTDKIQCPVLVCEAEADHFFVDQPRPLAEALGHWATYKILTAADSAQEHCHVGAADFVTSLVMDWVEDNLFDPGETRVRHRRLTGVEER